jgi:hypothetical protein
MLDLAPLNRFLTERGIRMLVEQRRQGLTVRGTFPQPDGSRRRTRIPLGLRAVPASLPTAELRCLLLHTAISEGTYPPLLPWSTPVHAPATSELAPLSCAAAIHSFQTYFWKTHARTAASERTWKRVATELNRLPPSSPLTLQQLVLTASSTTPGSRSRLESVKVFKRLARQQGLSGNLDQLTDLQGNYEPAPRSLPEDDALLPLLDALRPTKWGWCYAAMATFGCRPAEIPSLILHDDGTAQCITIKRHSRLPSLRTCFALPRAWIDHFNLQQVSIPGGAHWTHPEQYDSALGKKFVDAWRHSRRSHEIRQIFAAHLPELDLYSLRHRWAVRSIEAGKPLTLCARALGHSAAVHERSYHRHIQAADLRQAMATESA